jgi:hypothetical protein
VNCNFDQCRSKVTCKIGTTRIGLECNGVSQDSPKHVSTCANQEAMACYRHSVGSGHEVTKIRHSVSFGFSSSGQLQWLGK